MRKTILNLFYIGLVTAVICLFYGFFIEPKMLKVRNIEFVEPEWKSTPLKIVFVADIHIGSWYMDTKRVAKIVDTINAQSADIVLIGGDYIDGHDADHEPIRKKFNTKMNKGLKELSGLKAPLGVYSTLGNHDDWYDADRGLDIPIYLSQAGIGLLDNAVLSVPHSGSSFCLIGLPDNWTGTIDLSVFDTCTDENKIAFMHSPDSFKYLPDDTILALAGHTHGGQINIPLIGRRVTATDIGPEFAYGELKYKGISAFVTAGIGTSMIPARFRSPPEIVVVSLSGSVRNTQ